MNYVTHKQLHFPPCNKLTNNTQVTSQDETLNVRSRRELGSMPPTTRTRAHPRDLIVAAAMGDEDVVRRLLKCYDAKIWTEQERQDEEGLTAMMHAAISGHESIVRLLIEAGGDVTERSACGGWTALMHAVYNEHESIVRLLIECGSDVNTKTYEGDLTYGGERELWSVLMIAAHYGNESIVRLLIEAGADVPYREAQFGRTALMLAAENGYESIVRLLIKEARGVRYWLETWLWIRGVERKDINGQTALLLAARGGHESTFHALVECGADDKVKFNGETPVQVLIEKVKGKQQNTDAAREHAQSVQQLIDEDTQQLSDGLYMKLCDMNKRAFDS